MIRAVIDTNILISGFFWGGIPKAVYAAAVAEKYQLVISKSLLQELQTVLNYPKLQKPLEASGDDANSILKKIQELADIVEPETIPTDIVRDPKDVAVIACAVGGKADFIVSGDKDLLVLEKVNNIPVLSPRTFLERLDLKSK